MSAKLINDLVVLLACCGAGVRKAFETKGAPSKAHATEDPTGRLGHAPTATQALLQLREMYRLSRNLVDLVRVRFDVHDKSNASVRCHAQLQSPRVLKLLGGTHDGHRWSSRRLL